MSVVWQVSLITNISCESNVESFIDHPGDCNVVNFTKNVASFIYISGDSYVSDSSHNPDDYNSANFH